MKIATTTATILIVAMMMIGCSAHRVSNNSTPPAPVTAWEQVNFDNLQIAVHNRAVSKALTAAYSAGFLDDSYYDTVSREGIAITKAHQQLTPLLKDAATIKSNSALIKSLLNTLVSSAGTLATAAMVKDPQSKQNIVSEAQLIGSLANTMLDLLQQAGLISERRCDGCSSTATIERRAI